MLPRALLPDGPPEVGADVEDVELPPSEPSFRLGGLGDSEPGYNWDIGGVVGGGVDSMGMTRRGLGPGLRRAKIQINNKWKVVTA